MKKEMFPRALEIATLMHKGQTRKKGNGEPYIEHPKRIAKQFKDDFKKTLSILHDAENTPKFFPIIKKEFPKAIYEGVIILTHKPKDNYFDYIMKIRNSQNVDAIEVKIQDLLDNCADLEEGSKKDKYRFALYILENAL